MTAVLLDQAAYEVLRHKVSWPLKDILVWGDRAFARRADRDDPGKPHEKVYVECTLGVIDVTA